MRTSLLIVATVAVVLVVLPPCAAQEAPSEEGWWGCNPEGTWYGSNSAGLNLILRISQVGLGRYTAVADGSSDRDVISYCLQDYTAWHGELVRTGRRTFWLRQVEFCDPDPATFPPDLFPSAEGIWLWGSEGELTLTTCDLIEAFLPTAGAYVWNPLDPAWVPPVAFVDPFDVPFPDPVVGSFVRMASP
jgi:hypothetical protein